MQADKQHRDGGPQTTPRLGLFAAALSFAVPGAGHLLLRRWLQAAVWLAGWILIAFVAGAGTHGPGALLLMAAAAVDAYLSARSDSRRDDGRPEPRSEPV